MKIELLNERVSGAPAPGSFLVLHDDGDSHVLISIAGEHGDSPTQRIVPLNEWKRMCASFVLATNERGTR